MDWEEREGKSSIKVLYFRDLTGEQRKDNCKEENYTTGNNRRAWACGLRSLGKFLTCTGPWHVHF